MLPPHLHPRASNYVMGITGNVTTYMIEENGSRLVAEDITPGRMTIFPRGMNFFVITATKDYANHPRSRLYPFHG